MKLFRYKKDGNYRTGIATSAGHFDVGEHVTEYDRDFFENGGLENLETLLVAGLAEISGDIEFGAPLYRPEKIICIGLNYLKHARESGMEPPKEPVVFFKAPSSLCGPFDNVIIPKNSEKTDWEVELAVIIGKKAQYVSEEEALGYVAGYAVHNDVSERAFQLEMGGQWVKGKSADTFAPLGPYIVTTDEVKDPNNLNLWLKLNGEKVQDGNTNDFIFNVQQVISYLSQFMTLTPGDVISTGTPEGVGLGMKPPKFLKSGDVIALGVEGIGEARQEVKAYGE
jgi:2,4-diketo-3-deoxy-L-fuconate hydrolase